MARSTSLVSGAESALGIDTRISGWGLISGTSISRIWTGSLTKAYSLENLSFHRHHLCLPLSILSTATHWVDLSLNLMPCGPLHGFRIAGLWWERRNFRATNGCLWTELKHVSWLVCVSESPKLPAEILTAVFFSNFFGCIFKELTDASEERSGFHPQDAPPSNVFPTCYNIVWR